MSYQCCCSFVVSVFSGSISPQLFKQFDSVWKPIKLTCSKFTSVDVVRITCFCWYIWFKFKPFFAGLTEPTVGNCSVRSIDFQTVLKSDFFFFFHLGRMSRVATVRFSVSCKYILGQMGYCSHLCNDLVAIYVILSPFEVLAFSSVYDRFSQLQLHMCCFSCRDAFLLYF